MTARTCIANAKAAITRNDMGRAVELLTEADALALKLETALANLTHRYARAAATIGACGEAIDRHVRREPQPAIQP